VNAQRPHEGVAIEEVVMLPQIAVSWTAAVVWLAVTAAVAFLVSWLATDVRETAHRPYIAVLTIVTLVVAGAYLTWSGLDTVDTIAHNAAWGVLGGVLVAVPVSAGIVRMPGHRVPVEAGRRTGTLGWEGAVYGIAEGILLSVLPALIVWNAADTAGWTDGWGGRLAAGAVALAASLLVIAVHHFGYWDYRNSHVLPVMLGCGLLTVAFLATGSVLAPVIGHIAMHVTGLWNGIELPPHRHVGTDSDRPAVV
jgi:hypothetical protein